MKLRHYLTILGIFGTILIIVANLGELSSFWSAFGHVRWYVIPLVIAAQLANYYSSAGYYRSFFAISQASMSLRKLFEISLGVNFASQVIPAGGLVSAAYLAQATRGHVSAGNATLAQLSRYVFAFLSHIPVLLLGLALLVGSNDTSSLSARLMILLVALGLVAVLLLLLILYSRIRIEQFLLSITRGVNWFGQTILHQRKPLFKLEHLAHFLDEFYQTYHQLAERKSSWWNLFWWSLGGNATEALTVYVVLISFGLWLNPGVAILTYTIAIATSVFGLLTNGIGAYEAGMAGTLVAFGTPLALSLAIVVVYRVLSLILFLPPGLYYYHMYLKDSHATASH